MSDEVDFDQEYQNRCGRAISQLWNIDGIVGDALCYRVEQDGSLTVSQEIASGDMQTRISTLIAVVHLLDLHEYLDLAGKS